MFILRVQGVLVAAAILGASQTALAFTPEATCEGWSTSGYWGNAAHAEGTAILQKLVSGSWVDLTGSVDSQTQTEAGEIHLGALWDAGQLNGTYRAFLTTVVYNGGDLDSEPFVFAAESLAFQCTPPPSFVDRRTPGYWKNHPEAWPVSELRIGDRTYSQACLLVALEAPTRGDIRIKLVHHLIAAELNLLSGSDPYATTGYPNAGSDVMDTIPAAHALLYGVVISCADGTLSGETPRGAARDEVNGAKDALDAYNNNL